MFTHTVGNFCLSVVTNSLWENSKVKEPRKDLNYIRMLQVESSLVNETVQIRIQLCFEIGQNVIVTLNRHFDLSVFLNPWL